MPELENKISWRVPYYVVVAVLIFIVVNSIAVLNVRGVVDGAGYQWNGAHYIPINTYEDDGRFNVYGALGYKGYSDRHEHLINTGGPYIHLARFLVWMGDKAGIVKRLKDRFDYYLYPEEYLKLWHFIGLYKAILLLGWMPLVMYWIGSRHFSESTGILACWLTVSIPFITGFEPKIKVDSVAITLGLFSLLWQLEYVRSHRDRYFMLAAAFLGISLSAKLNMLPALFSLGITYAIVLREKKTKLLAVTSWKRFFFSIFIMAALFFITNPFAIKGMVIYVRHLFSYLQSVKTQSPTGLLPIINSIGYRIIHFDSHYGKTLNWLVIPALLFSIGRLFIMADHRSVSSGIVSVVLWGFIAYMAFVTRDGVIFLTYYYYTPAILLLILIADLLASMLEKAMSVSRLAAAVAGVIVIALISSTAYENSRVFAYMTSKTNRQEMNRWIDKNIPEGTVIGIPLNQGGSFFNLMMRLDPFKYKLTFVGAKGELLDDKKPDYFLWILSSKDSAKISRNDYSLASEFSRGTDLPHERYDLYQEEVFQLYRRNPVRGADAPQHAPAGIEYEVGSLMRKDPEDEFRVLQFQSISFMPQWLNLMRKDNGTLDFDSAEGFDRTIWGDNADAAKYGYIHQIGPTTLQLWGVKYILAKMTEGSPVKECVLNSGRYNLKEIDFPDGVKRDASVFYNNDYLGQIFFAQCDKAKEYRYERKLFSWLRLWKKKDADEHLRDTLFDTAALRTLNTDNLAVYMEIKSEMPVSVTIRGGGNAETWIAGGATKTIWMPYRIFNHNEPLIYEINPVEGKTEIVVKKVEVMPIVLRRAPVIGDMRIDEGEGSAIVNTDSDGEIIFSLPYNKYWKARVDGKGAPVKEGLAGTVAVEVSHGRHTVAVHF